MVRRLIRDYVSIWISTKYAFQVKWFRNFPIKWIEMQNTHGRMLFQAGNRQSLQFFFRHFDLQSEKIFSIRHTEITNVYAIGCDRFFLFIKYNHKSRVYKTNRHDICRPFYFSANTSRIDIGSTRFEMLSSHEIRFLSENLKMNWTWNYYLK